MQHKLTWYGHSNFRLETGGKTFLIDPFFEGNPNSPVSPEELGKVDIVLITHDHGDHVGQAVEICKATGAVAIGVYDTIQKLQAEGLPDNAVGMNIGGSIEQAGVRIKMVQAMHSTASGAAAGYILTLPDGYCIYHAGDTGLFASMELFGKFHAIDLALLPIGGWFTMDPQQAAYACKLLKCKFTIPMHWGTFPILEQNTENFARELERLAPETSLRTMKPGATVPLQKLGPDLNCGCDD